MEAPGEREDAGEEDEGSYTDLRAGVRFWNREGARVGMPYQSAVEGG